MIKIGYWDSKDIDYAIALEEELMAEAEKGTLGLLGCQGEHYPGVAINGVIQCQDCCCFYENDRAISYDLKRIFGEGFWEKELVKIKQLQFKVRKGTNKSGPVYYHWVAPSGKLKVMGFYYE